MNDPQEVQTLLEHLQSLVFRARVGAWPATPGGYFTATQHAGSLLEVKKLRDGELHRRPHDRFGHFYALGRRHRLQILTDEKRPRYFAFDEEHANFLERRFRSRAHAMQTLKQHARALALDLGEATPYPASPYVPLPVSDASRSLFRARAILETKRALSIPKALSPLPEIVVDGRAIPEKVLAHLLRREFDKGELAASAALLTLTDTDPLALHLLERGLAHRVTWAVEAAGALGGTQTARAAALALQSLTFDSSAHARAVSTLNAVETMAWRGEAHAVLGLFQVANTTVGYRRRRAVAIELLSQVAAASDQRPTQLVLEALSAPPADLDDEVRLRFLSAMFFERAMCRGERFYEDDLERAADASEIVSGLLPLLVFARVRDDVVCGTTRRDIDGWVNAAGDRVQLDFDETLSVLHPIEVASEERIAWRAHLRERQLVPPIEQIDRAVFALSDAELASRTLQKFEGTPIDQVRAELEALDLKIDPMHESFAGPTWREPMSVRVYVTFNGQHEEIGAVTANGALFHELHPVSISELQRALVPGGIAPSDDVARQHGRHPFARVVDEVDCCEVCREPIAPGETAIVYERLDDEHTRHIALAHPGCRGSALELRATPYLERALFRNSLGAWPPTP